MADSTSERSKAIRGGRRVFDPETRIASQWSRERNRFEPMEQIVLTNDQVIDVAEAWKELNRRLQPRHP